MSKYNIYKKFSIKHLLCFTTYNIYLESRYVTNFTKNKHDILVNWLWDVLTEYISTHTELTTHIMILFIKCIKRITIEVLYDIIRYHYNFVNLGQLQLIGLTCLTISIKYVYGYDYGKVCMHNLILFTNNTYTLQKFLTMERYIFTTCHWVVGHKSQLRLGMLILNNTNDFQYMKTYS